jgi:2-polyprenyl-3-methyl-5-hydroxy-6-metoxy-1,4-benzoquinol methylase
VQALREFYENDANKRRTGRDLAQPQIISLSMMNITSKDLILEVGCGGGALLREIDRRGAIAIGVDISIGQIKYAKDQLKSGHAIVCDAAYLPLREGQFTKCFAIEILEHVQNPSKMMNEIDRILKCDGELTIVVPNNKNWFMHRILQGYFCEAFYDYGHLHDFSSIEKLAPFLKSFKISMVKESDVPTIPMRCIIALFFRCFNKISRYQKANVIPTKKHCKNTSMRLLTYEKHLLSLMPRLPLHLIIKLKKNEDTRRQEYLGKGVSAL